MPKVKLVGSFPAPFKDDRVRLEILNGLRRTGTAIRKEFQKTVKTWEHKPDFSLEGVDQNISLRDPVFYGVPSVEVSTDDEIYKWVSEGTREHDIPLVLGGPRLFFAGEFEPKTQPGVIDSFAGYQGERNTVRDTVHHPGIEEPRDFEGAIQEIIEPVFLGEMQEAMRRAAKASGWAL